MPISLKNAAKYYKELSHQIAAWNFLEGKIPEEVLDEFAEIYRASPEKFSTKIITPDVMQQLTGYAANKFDATFCSDFNKLLAATNFDKHESAMCMLIANLMHETGNFRWMSEIADGSAYEMRADLGNIYPGDGKKYKGAGVLMLTGRYNYERCAETLQDPKIVERGWQYVTEHYPFRSALGWIKDNDLLNVCLTKGFDDCCYRINGGWNGKADRDKKYAICKKVFGIS